jgi:hypothetical protein
MSNYNIYFCSFADKRLHRSLKRIERQASAINFFKKIFCYNETNLEKSFKKQFAQFLTEKTFYLCAWKPQLILQVFKKMNDADILVYADSGCHLNPKGLTRLKEYCEIASNTESGILATTFDASMPEKDWTKADTFDYFNCGNDISITDTPQIQATTFIIQKNAKTIAFVKQWLKVFEEDPSLADRGYFKNNNLDGFQDHRSDQSFFSILGKMHHIKLISANEVQGSANWEKDMIEYPIWAKRDKDYDASFWINPSLGKLLLIVKRKFRK